MKSSIQEYRDAEVWAMGVVRFGEAAYFITAQAHDLQQEPERHSKVEQRSKTWSGDWAEPVRPTEATPQFRSRAQVEEAMAVVSDAIGLPVGMTGLRDGLMHFDGQRLLFDFALLHWPATRKAADPLWWVAHEWAHWTVAPHRRDRVNYGWGDVAGLPHVSQRQALHRDLWAEEQQAIEQTRPLFERLLAVAGEVHE